MNSNILSEVIIVLLKNQDYISTRSINQQDKKDLMNENKNLIIKLMKLKNGEYEENIKKASIKDDKKSEDEPILKKMKLELKKAQLSLQQEHTFKFNRIMRFIGKDNDSFGPSFKFNGINCQIAIQSRMLGGKSWLNLYLFTDLDSSNEDELELRANIEFRLVSRFVQMEDIIKKTDYKFTKQTPVFSIPKFIATEKLSGSDSAKENGYVSSGSISIQVRIKALK